MARRVSRLVKEGKFDKKYQKYVTTRLLVMPGSLAWVLYCMDEYKMYKHKHKDEIKQIEDI